MLKINIQVMWEDPEGNPQEVKSEGISSFESAEMELGKLERYVEKIQYRAENDAERAEEDAQEDKE